MLKPLIAYFLLVTLLPSQAFAWNALGHKVVAEIAWQEISPEKRQEIVDKLRRHPRFAEDFVQTMPADVANEDHWVFQHAATWPDLARSIPPKEGRNRYDHPTWHYVNFPLFVNESDRRILTRLNLNLSDEYPTDRGTGDYNIMQAFRHCQAAMSSKQVDAPTKALAYCWLFHLVGDSHQPLHSVSLYNVDHFPSGDRGGNAIRLTRGGNLHSLWDNLLGRRHYMGDVQRELDRLEEDRTAWKVSTGSDVRPWLAESRHIAETFVYDRAILQAVRDTPRGTELEPITLSDEYLRSAGEHARRRIVAAGLRLGSLLNDGS